MAADEEGGEFDLRTVSANFRQCIGRNGAGAEDVNLTNYVRGYNELNKLFYEMGRMFSFIADDVKEKTHILAEHQRSGVGNQYDTVGGMMVYEKDNGILADGGQKKNALPNGSRTLLRLHRALLFTVKFLDGVHQLKDGENSSPVARKAYDETLSPHHGWGVRQLAHLALKTLPKREKLIAKFSGNVPANEVDGVFDEAVGAVQAAYDVVQRKYEQNNLLNLP